jgi:hypothetical protein
VPAGAATHRSDLCHVHAVPTDGLTALSARRARLVRAELVRASLLVSRTSAFTRNLPLLAGIHGSESALAPRALRYVRHGHASARLHRSCPVHLAAKLSEISWTGQGDTPGSADALSFCFGKLPSEDVPQRTDAPKNRSFEQATSGGRASVAWTWLRSAPMNRARAIETPLTRVRKLLAQGTVMSRSDTGFSSTKMSLYSTMACAWLSSRPIGPAFHRLGLGSV